MEVKIPNEICGIKLTKVDMIWHYGLQKVSFSIVPQETDVNKIGR
jgi:hypothetical protein